MRRFYVRHLICLTTLAAVAFAVASRLEQEFVITALSASAVFAPCVCYSIAAVMAATKRPIRQVVRHALLAVILATIVAVAVAFSGSGVVPLLLFLLFLLWTPQLILLKFCSAYRSAVAGTVL